MADLSPPERDPVIRRRIVQIYDYVDLDGVIQHQTVRYLPKHFSQRHPDATQPDGYAWNLQGVTRVLYALPEVMEAIALGHPIFLVEGEKDADFLRTQGLTATTNPMGAQYWKDSFTETLRDAHVIVLPDFDQAGLRVIEKVAHKLLPVVASLKVVTVFHTSEPKSDVFDWFAAGGTRAEFDAFVENAPFYTTGVPPAVHIDVTPVTPALPPGVARPTTGLQTWLHRYIQHSQYWAPRAAPGYHAAVGLWVLSTVAARRIVVHMGSNDIFPTLFIALISESTLWTKTTVGSLGVRLLRRAGCGHLLGPDRTTPQYLLKLMSGIVPREYSTVSPEEQEELRKAFGFSAQRGWFYEEWGGMLHQMRRVDSPQADLNKLLIVLEGGASLFETATIQRGLERIHAPYLALLGLATPHDLLPFMEEGDAWWHDGFWPRFICVTPPWGQTPSRTPMPREPYSIPADLIRQLHDWHTTLGDPVVSIDEVVETSGKRTGEWRGAISGFPQRTLTLANETYDAYETYDNALADLIQEGKVHSDLSPWYGRAAQKALRVAMLLASIEGFDTLTLPYWDEAQALVETWRVNLHELVGTVGMEGQTSRQAMRRVRLEKKIESLLSLNGVMTGRELQKHLYKVAGDELNATLESMVKIGTIIKKPDGKKNLYLIFEEDRENDQE